MHQIVSFDSLPDILQEISKEDEEKHNRRLRRIVAKQDRLKTRPPRLGKYKYDTRFAFIILYVAQMPSADELY